MSYGETDNPWTSLGSVFGGTGLARYGSIFAVGGSTAKVRDSPSGYFR